MTIHLSNPVPNSHQDAGLIHQCCQKIERKLTVKKVLCSLRKGYRNWSTRRELMNISEDSMKDLGLTKSAVYHEMKKPFWK